MFPLSCVIEPDSFQECFAFFFLFIAAFFHRHFYQFHVHSRCYFMYRLNDFFFF